MSLTPLPPPHFSFCRVIAFDRDPAVFDDFCGLIEIGRDGTARPTALPTHCRRWFGVIVGRKLFISLWYH